MHILSVFDRSNNGHFKSPSRKNDQKCAKYMSNIHEETTKELLMLYLDGLMHMWSSSEALLQHIVLEDLTSEL